MATEGKVLMDTNMATGEDTLMAIEMATDMVIEMATGIDITGTIMTTDTIEMVIGEVDTATFPIGGIFVHTGITTDVTESKSKL
jgi:hypothetical protein